jgi:hypothetical protein
MKHLIKSQQIFVCCLLFIAFACNRSKDEFIKESITNNRSLEKFPIEVTLTNDEATTVVTNGKINIVDVFTPPKAPPKPGTWQPKSVYHLFPEQANLELLWQGEPFVHPRGIMLDPDSTTLWISDPGDAERDPVNKPARIIRVPIVNGKPTQPTIFFSKPGFLWSAKWAFPTIINGQKVLIVADQGEATSEYTFTGRGAKVFILPVQPDNSAGTPLVLWEGRPFACPTGVAFVNNIIYITDPCAGPLREDPINSGYTFPTSSVFAMRPIVGSMPSTLFSGEPFTSLIGICALDNDSLIFNDTDSGRPDGGETGRSGFSPPRSADRWIVKILEPNAPVLSEPTRSLFTEQGDIKINFKTIQNAINSGLIDPSDSLVIKGRAGTRIITANGPIDSISYQINKMESATVGSLPYKFARLTIASDVMADSISFTVRIKPNANLLRIQSTFFTDCFCSMEKDPNRGNLFADNKHGGSGRVRARSPQARIANNISNSNSNNLIRYTLDNKLGHGSVWVYPEAGGTPKALYIGPPLSRPLGGQLSPDENTLWFTDQGTGSLYALPFPTLEQFNRLYGLK